MISEESGESADLNSYEGEVDKGLSAFDGGFIVADQAAMPHEPAEGPLNHPTAGQNLEAPGGVRTLHDFNLERWTQRFDPFGKCLTGVATVSPDEAQPTQPAEYTFQEQFRSVAFCCARSCDFNPKHQPEGINQQVPLAPFDVLGSVEAYDTPMGIGFDALTVQNGCGRPAIPSIRFADQRPQAGIDRLPHVVPDPTPKDVINRFSGRKISRNHAPRATGFDNIQQRIKDPAQIGSRTPTGFGRRKHRFNQVPLRVRQIRRVIGDFHRLTELPLISAAVPNAACQAHFQLSRFFRRALSRSGRVRGNQFPLGLGEFLVGQMTFLVKFGELTEFFGEVHMWCPDPIP